MQASYLLLLNMPPQLKSESYLSISIDVKMLSTLNEINGYVLKTLQGKTDEIHLAR